MLGHGSLSTHNPDVEHAVVLLVTNFRCCVEYCSNGHDLTPAWQLATVSASGRDFLGYGDGNGVLSQAQEELDGMCLTTRYVKGRLRITPPDQLGARCSCRNSQVCWKIMTSTIDNIHVSPTSSTTPCLIWPAWPLANQQEFLLNLGS